MKMESVGIRGKLRAFGSMIWWPGRELNPRRQPFQGCALPPELPGHVSEPAGFAGHEDCSLHADFGGMVDRKRLDAGNVWNGFDYNNHSDFPQHSQRLIVPFALLLP